MRWPSLDNFTKHDTMMHVLVALMAKLETLERGPPDKPPQEEEKPDPGNINLAGKG